MLIYRFIALAVFFISVHGIVEQKYNETDVAAVQQFVFPTFKIPDLLNPDKSGSDSSASIPQKEKLINIGLPTFPRILPTALPKLPTIKLPTLPHLLPTALPKIPTIKLPTLPNLLPTALPKIPTIHIPTLPHLLPTALPKLPTIKIPTLPHILPTALPKIPTIKIPTFPHILPTLFPPKPKPTSSSEDNLICNICESAVTIVKTKILTVEKSVRAKLGVLLGGLCDMLMSNPGTMFLGPPCTMFKANIIDKIFQKLDNFENSIDPKSFCKHNNPTDPPLSPVCTNCLDGVISVKNTIQKIANFAKITIGTTIDKVCDHIVPEFDFLEAICHVIDQNIEDKVYKFIMAIHDKINERFLCYILSFCPK
ncbi:unnamed protein product [Caenorhabditis brenneri]